MDQTLPQWVKDRYSPRESWKGKPFTREDAHFFFKGIEELSDLFTQERGRALQRYFEHARFRSGYLLYFLPLQAAKFVAVFERHSKFMTELLTKPRSVLRVADLGAGPCTASIAWLLWLLDHAPRDIELPAIEIHAVDIHDTILGEGAELLRLIAQSFPRLRSRVTVTVERATWQDWARKTAQRSVSWDFILLGHVLNEGRDRQLEAWSQLYSRSQDGGIIAIEPASKGSSQGLSQLRDLILEQFETERTPTGRKELSNRSIAPDAQANFETDQEAPTQDPSEDDEPALPLDRPQALEGLPAPSIIGPCPHFQACPMAEGPDWCHFSFPAQLPGEWFSYFSKGLGSERQWLKFSYLWMTRKPKAPSQLPLLISDALTKRNTTVEALICRPERAEKVSFEVSLQKLRGPLGLRGGWLTTKASEIRSKKRPAEELSKKDSAGPRKGTSRKGRPEKAGRFKKGH
ncbi:MAG: hypothetical protein RJB38_198 [Pseudomonadota bacterium]